jgi:outer membrane protein
MSFKQHLCRSYIFVIVCICSICLSVLSIQAQQTLRLDIEDVVTLAQSTAPDVLIAQTRLSNSYWQYQSFRADFRPLIRLESDLPSLNRTISPIILPDGSETFIQRSLMRNGANLSLIQDISATGGRVFVSSGLERLDIFRTSINPGGVSWLSTPLSVGFVQPFFQFNALKWNKKTEPLRYEEAKSRYNEDMERVAYNAVLFFFEVFRSQAILDGAIIDKANADTLLEISKGRFSVGRIAETELLQIELQSMNANDAIAEATLRLQTSTDQLRNFLGIKTKVAFVPTLPEALPEIFIDPETALYYARKNRSLILDMQRQLIEADRNVDQAEKNNGFTIDVVGSVGLSQTAPTVTDAYLNPLNQEQVSVRLAVPIADWGKAKARRETARSNRELVKMSAEQDLVNFEQQILLKAQQFELVKNRVRLSEKSLEVAQKRQDLTRQRYLIGKIGITDLNQALADLDRARRSYIDAQREFWVSLYELRSLTLYDFERNVPLIE